MRLLEPTNETEVIIRFAQEAKNKGIEILQAQVSFPDMQISLSGKEFAAELEFRSSNFIAHGHDVKACDLIICWLDDWPNYLPKPIPVWELSNPGWQGTPLKKGSEAELELAYWQIRAIRAENAQNLLRAERDNLRIALQSYRGQTKQERDLCNEDLRKIEEHAEIERREVLEKIIELYENECSQRAIELEIFGYAGGQAYSVVKTVIDTMGRSE